MEKKRIYSTALIFILFICVFVITVSPVLSLRDGGLAKAVLNIYFSFFHKHFSVSFLPSFWSLFPLCFLLLFSAVFNYLKGKPAIYLAVFFVITGSILVCRSKVFFVFLGVVMIISGGSALAFFFKVIHERKKDKEQTFINPDDDAEILFRTEADDGVRLYNPDFSLEDAQKKAKELLDKIVIPKYKNFDDIVELFAENGQIDSEQHKPEARKTSIEDIKIALRMPDISEDGHISFKVPESKTGRGSDSTSELKEDISGFEFNTAGSSGKYVNSESEISESSTTENDISKNEDSKREGISPAPVIVVQKEADGNVQVKYTSVKPGQTVVLTDKPDRKKEQVKDRESELDSSFTNEQNNSYYEDDHETDEADEADDSDNDTPDSEEDYISAVAHLSSSHLNKLRHYEFPSESYLPHYEPHEKPEEDLENDINGKRIVETFSQFNISTRLIKIQYGPTFTLYELSLGAGIKVSSVNSVADNIAMVLEASSVRIIAPIPGKNAIGVEVPNKIRDVIGLDELLPKLKKEKKNIPMVLGRTIMGDPVIIDVAKAPHLLIAGTTGSGKSVCINTLICSILYTKKPNEVKLIMIDPKFVELSLYNDIPHLLTPVVTDVDRAVKVLQFCVEEMNRRTTMFSKVNARNIIEYNETIKSKKLINQPLPYIVLIFDEFADFMIQRGKEITELIKRITALARFTGIHLVMATQRPSSDVTAGLIKINIPSRIAFSVSDAINSRIILDTTGAEKLLGNGDMLYLGPDNKNVIRIQGAYIGKEVEKIVSDVKAQGEPDYIDESFFEDETSSGIPDERNSSQSNSKDRLMQAWKIVAAKGEASASYLQRRMSIGFNTAAKLIEELEELGYIGPAKGSKPRDIYVFPDEY